MLAAAIAAFVWNRLPVGVVALGVMLALWATGVVTLPEALSGFASPTVVLIAALFVVAEGLDAAGLTTWVGQAVVRYAGASRVRLVLLTMAAVAVLSALITPNGAVAALYPLVVVLAVRFAKSPSRLLMPAAFAAHAGALLVLTGSPVTLLVSAASDGAGAGRFGFFEVALVGLPLLLGTMLVTLLLGNRLLPERKPRAFSRDLTALPATLRRQYIAEDELARLTVGTDSPLVGSLPGKLVGPDYPDVHVISVRDRSGAPLGDEPVAEGARLLVRGDREEIRRFALDNWLVLTGDADAAPESSLIDKEFGVAEVIVSPRSDYIGDDVFPGMVTDSGQLVVLAVQRYGTDLGVSPATLKAGDSLLLHGRWDALDEHTNDPNVVLVDSPDAIRRQAVPLGRKATPAVLVLLVMVVLLATGIVPAAIAMVVLRVVSVEQAHRSMSWTVLILIGAMIPLSTAITESGAAEALAKGLLGAIGGGGPGLVMTGLFLVTAVLGQLISNTATALVLIPIAVSVAAEGGYSAMTLLMSLNVAAHAALLTPIATPANLMVMGPAGYRFGDYWRFGLPVMVVYYLVAVFIVLPFWPP